MASHSARARPQARPKAALRPHFAPCSVSWKWRSHFHEPAPAFRRWRWHSAWAPGPPRRPRHFAPRGVFFPPHMSPGKMIRILSGLRRKPGRGYPFLDLSPGDGGRESPVGCLLLSRVPAVRLAAERHCWRRDGGRALRCAPGVRHRKNAAPQFLRGGICLMGRWLSLPVRRGKLNSK